MAKPTLAELGILNTNNGIWIHQCPHSEGDLRDRAQARAHGQELRAHGVTGIMQFGSTTRVESSIGYREVGVSTIFRPWRGHILGAPAVRVLMPANEAAQFVAAGTKIIQPFNEQNLPEEWIDGPYHGLPPKADWARIVIDLYQESLNAYGPAGAYSALPPLSPGGVYGFQHRECWDMMLNEIVRRGIQNQIKVICLHPRPHNFPPDTDPNGITVAFNEYKRYITTAQAAGIDAWFYAGEHGASIGAHDDPARPPVDLAMWTDWNRTFYQRMNPAHLQTIWPEMISLCYWLSGDGGTWFEDSWDQGRGRMPAPSPLYVWMGEHESELRWTRSGGDEPPEPPVTPDLKIYKGDGSLGDWAWLNSKYGDGVDVITPAADAYWKITEIRENLGGASSVTVKAPVGTPVMFWYTTAPNLPATVNREWATVGAWTAVEPKGECSFGLYGDADYNPAVAPFRGPHNLWCGTSVEHSEQFIGEGWLMGTEHHHLDIKFEFVTGDEPPEPPTEDFRKPFDGDYAITCGFACHKDRVPPSTAPGVDYATPLGTPALAVADALVMDRGQNAVAGRWLEIICRVGDGWYRITYRHLQDYVVRAGFEVKQGALIGHTGHTGNATGPCLHVDAQRLGAFIDPEELW